jgi:DNA repair exonuclease SbcCD ATPase subunit
MEFISLSNLITMGVVVFILVIYRYLDKNNRSLEKVKRFTDKVKDNLSGFIEEKTQEIQNLSIDMQVNLKTAKEILKRIGDIEGELKNKAKSIDTLHSKVNKYDTLIAELNNATIAVEENLKRIHDESAFIDKVGKRMKSAQARLTQIEKQIPGILEEFKQKNNKDLKDIQHHLVDEMSGKMEIIQEEVQGAEARVKDFSVYLTRLEGRRDTMEKEMVKKFGGACQNFETRMLQKKAQVAKSFKEEMSGYLAEVNKERDQFKHSMAELIQGSSVEINDLEDRMLKHLIEYKKDIEQAELTFKQNIAKVVEAGKDLEHDIFTELKGKIKQDSQKVHEEVEKRLAQFAREVENRNNEIIGILGKSKQDTEVWKNSIAKKIEEQKKELITSFMNSKAEIEADIGEFIQKNENTRKEFEARLYEFVKTSEDRMGVLDNDFSMKINDMNNNFSAFENDYSHKFEDIEARVDEEKEQILVDFNEKMKHLEKQCAARHEQLKNDFESINGLGDDIQFRIKNIKKDLQECSCDLIGKIDEFKTRFSEDLTIASGEVETVVMKNVEQRMEEYENDTAYRFEKLEQVQTDIDLLEQSLRDFMEAKKEDLKTDFDIFIGELKESKNEEREYTDTVLKEIRSEIQTLDDEVRELKAKAYENVSEKLKVFEDDFFADLKERNEAMAGQLQEWQASVKEKMDSISEGYAEERRKLEDQYTVDMNKSISSLSDKTKGMFDEFEEKWQEILSAEINSSREQFDRITGDYKEEVKTVILDIENNFISRQESINTDIENYKQDVQQIIDKIKEDFASRKDDINGEMEKYREEIHDMISGVVTSFTSQRNIINTDMEQHREDMKKSLFALENNVNSQRESIAAGIAKYKEEVENTIKDIKDDYSTRQEHISQEVKAYQESISGDVGQFKESITGDVGQFKETIGQDVKKFKETISQDVEVYKETIGEDVEAYRDTINLDIGKYRDEIKKIIQGIENNFSVQREDLIEGTEKERKALKEEIGSCQQKLTSFEKRLSEETHTVLSGFESRYKQKQDEFTKRLRELQAGFEEKIKEFKASINEGTAFLLNTRKEQKTEVKNLDEKVKALGRQLKDMAGKAIASCEEEYENLKEDFFHQTKVFDENVEKKISAFETAFKQEQEKIRQVHDRLSGKMEEEYKALSDNLKEIDRQQKNFTAQTKLFDRADSLKLTLKNEIEDLRKDLKLLEPAQKKVKFLETEIAKVNKLAEDLNSKALKFNAEKRRIDNMENNFKELLHISDTIDEKLADATAAYDSLQDIKIKIRELGELSTDVQNRYDRLEKKKEVIETTTTGVDNNFKLLEDLESEIKKIEESVESLPPRVHTLDQEINILLKNKPEADHAVEKMKSLDKLMTDMEERTRKLNSAREWLARTETRLETIGKSAQDQLKILQALIKEDGGNGKKHRGAPKQDKREMIIKLARQGWSPREISKATNTSMGEVELILELEPKKR